MLVETYTYLFRCHTAPLPEGHLTPHGGRTVTAREQVPLKPLAIGNVPPESEASAHLPSSISSLRSFYRRAGHTQLVPACLLCVCAETFPTVLRIARITVHAVSPVCHLGIEPGGTGGSSSVSHCSRTMFRCETTSFLKFLEILIGVMFSLPHLG